MLNTFLNGSISSVDNRHVAAVSTVTDLFNGSGKGGIGSLNFGLSENLVKKCWPQNANLGLKTAMLGKFRGKLKF